MRDELHIQIYICKPYEYEQADQMGYFQERTTFPGPDAGEVWALMLLGKPHNSKPSSKSGGPESGRAA